MNSVRNIVFFGTSEFSVVILEELKKEGIVPSLLITAPDRPAGRGMKLTPPPVKIWADENGIAVIQPETLENLKSKILHLASDLFIVAAYGEILSKELLAIPKRGTLNVHPSLLPKLRGASPIQTAILNDEKDAVGVTIMLVDEKLDHGPIVAQASVELEDLPAPDGGGQAGWPPKASVLERLLAHEGGKLLAEVIPLWVKGKITPEPQDNSHATYSKKITKEDGLIDLSADPYQNFLKIRAYEGWPGAFFREKRAGKDIRVKVTDATFKDGKLEILKVIPEGKREMSYQDFLNK